MNLTEEQYKKIEDYAAALMSAKEIAILLDFNEDEEKIFVEKIKNHKKSQEHKSFLKGRLTTKFELRKVVIDLAKMGSQSAQVVTEKYLKENLYG